MKTGEMRLIRASTALQWLRIYRLYQSAFPRDEKKPFCIIRKMQKKGKTDVWYFEKDGRYLGFATTINGETKILIDYLAVKKKLRGRGIGTEMLGLLFDKYRDKGVFLEIERVDVNAKNANERIKRKQFYLSSGLEELGVEASVFGVGMELLGKNCTMSFEEYRAFYKENYSPFAADNIKRISPL